MKYKSIKAFLKPYKLFLAFYIFKMFKSFTICNSEETINNIVSSNLSISRFGDGEFAIMQHGGTGFQDANPLLADRLLEILNSVGSNSQHIVCLPYPIESLDELGAEAKIFWHDFIASNCRYLLKTIPHFSHYYDTNFTRFYIDFRDKSRCRHKIDNIKRIWQDRNVVIVEGNGTRMGVNNDLLYGAASIRRIICPSTNAFDIYDQIIDYILNHIEKTSLILCALGMTATVLAFDLSKAGYQSIDIGHLDIEYEWFLMNALEKCPIEGKSVNECGVRDPDQIDSFDYQAQIIHTIKR